MARAAYENGVREIPVDIDADTGSEVRLLTDWLNFSYNNWQQLLTYCVALCREYTFRFSDDDDRKAHPAFEDLRAIGGIYVSNIGEYGTSKFPCQIVDHANELHLNYIEQMKITFAVTDASKAKWTNREKPDFVVEYAKAYNDYEKRAQQVAKLKAQREKERRAEAAEKQKQREKEDEARLDRLFPDRKKSKTQKTESKDKDNEQKKSNKTGK